MEQKITLLELNEQIGKVLKDTLPASVWVIAEISELKENWSGHCYLELVEKQGSEIVARVSCYNLVVHLPNVKTIF